MVAKILPLLVRILKSFPKWNGVMLFFARLRWCVGKCGISTLSCKSQSLWSDKCEIYHHLSNEYTKDTKNTCHSQSFWFVTILTPMKIEEIRLLGFIVSEERVFDSNCEVIFLFLQIWCSEKSVDFTVVDVVHINLQADLWCKKITIILNVKMDDSCW